MKKRIISFLLLLCMVLSLLPVTADAYVGDIPGVDYTRIEYNTILDQEVKFKIGSHEFTGKLSNGNRLDEETVDIIILELMISYGMNSDKLKELHAMAGEGLKYDESRYLQPQGLV